MTLIFGTNSINGGSGGGGGGASIDDTTISTQTAYSSSKCVNTFVSSATIRTMLPITQSDYDDLVEGGTVDANTLYVITDAS